MTTCTLSAQKKRSVSLSLALADHNLGVVDANATLSQSEGEGAALKKAAGGNSDPAPKEVNTVCGLYCTVSPFVTGQGECSTSRVNRSRDVRREQRSAQKAKPNRICDGKPGGL